MATEKSTSSKAGGQAHAASGRDETNAAAVSSEAGAQTSREAAPVAPQHEPASSSLHAASSSCKSEPAALRTPALGRMDAELARAVQNPMMAQARNCTIKEAAQLLDVAPSTLRYWEDEGLVTSARSVTGNYRSYSIRDLFGASYVAFFRNMGVPVKTLTASQNDSLEGIAGMLEATQEEVDVRLRKLERVSNKLKTQRSLARHAAELIEHGVRAASPSAQRFLAYAPESERQRKALLRDSQRYGVLISVTDPTVMIEGCIDFPGDAPSYDADLVPATLWERDEEAQAGVTYFEGVAFSKKGGNVKVEVGGLFEAARRMGRTPLYALAHFLITANFGERKDCYRVWVACAEDDEG